jgi:hypothetical protein
MCRGCTLLKSGIIGGGVARCFVPTGDDLCGSFAVPCNITGLICQEISRLNFVTLLSVTLNRLVYLTPDRIVC